MLVSGELGAGKTTFVRGALRSLGVEGPVTSPTFVVGHLHDGRDGPLAHLDLYRLAGMGGEDPGLLDPFFAEDTIAFVEWPEHADDAWPAGARRRIACGSRTRAGTSAGSRSSRDGAIVGIDTATSATSVAVLVPGGREVERRDDPAPGERPRHAETLQPLLEQALAQAEVGWEDVARICVGHRPGRVHRPAARDLDRPRARAGPRPAARRRLEPRGAGPRDRARRAARSSTCPGIPICTARCWR